MDDAALLQLIWLASPALPVGGFSYSEGLEAAVEAGLVKDEGSAGEWLQAQLEVSLGRGDLAVVVAAVEAMRGGDAEAVARLDAWVRMTRETSEFRLQAEQMGKSLGEWRRSLGTGVVCGSALASTSGDALHTQRSVASLHHQPTKTEQPQDMFPVAFARAAAASAATARQAGLAFAFAWAENMVQAAIRAVPLGQGAGQRILARLAAAIPAAVDHAQGLGEDERQAFAPMLAILSSQHETQYSRLFRS